MSCSKKNTGRPWTTPQKTPAWIFDESHLTKSDQVSDDSAAIPAEDGVQNFAHIVQESDNEASRSPDATRVIQSARPSTFQRPGTCGRPGTASRPGTNHGIARRKVCTAPNRNGCRNSARMSARARTGGSRGRHRSRKRDRG